MHYGGTVWDVGLPAAPLALSDGLSVALAVFQLAFSGVVSVALWRLTAWQRQYEGLEARLQDATARLVEERFRAATVAVDGHVGGLAAAVDELKDRLASGDAQVRAMGERDQRIELALSAKIDVLKDYIRESAAGKKDLERHEAAAERRLLQLERRLVALAGTVAVLAERGR